MLLSLPLLASAALGMASADVQFDYGLEALAIKSLTSISTIPFSGPYRHYRGYLSDTADTDFKVAYKKAVHDGVPNALLAKDPWMMPFSGVMGPSEFLDFQGVKYLWASSCRPHDCPDANIYLLYDPVHKLAWGAAHADAQVFVFGEPSTPQEALLLDLTARNFFSYDEPFPLADATASKVKAVLRASGGSIEALIDSSQHP